MKIVPATTSTVPAMTPGVRLSPNNATDHAALQSG